ncbi:hypothetical protein GCM10027030_27760 [Luteococcus sediminum]
MNTIQAMTCFGTSPAKTSHPLFVRPGEQAATDVTRPVPLMDS